MKKKKKKAPDCLCIVNFKDGQRSVDFLNKNEKLKTQSIMLLTGSRIYDSFNKSCNGIAIIYGKAIGD